MESKTGQKKPSSMLGPGFRFHPTDEELVQYYLKRKVCGKAFRFDAISVVDVYKTEPWDLPHMSKLKTRDLEWYFFSLLDKKYGNGARTNRATLKGYWKTTGKDRAVYHKKQIVGMKKTLVYHNGRAPKGLRTNWVMHEYRLAGSELETAGTAQDAFVLCRVFQKSGSGPKNGEQYGAPFVEEEWDNDGLELVPECYATEEEVDFGDDACLNSRDLQQILGSDVPSNTAPLPVNLPCDSHVEETTESFIDIQKLLAPGGDQYCESKLCDEKNIYNLPASYNMDVIPVKQENIGECSKSGNSDDLDFLLNEPFLDTFDYLPNVDEGFIEANDFSNPTETSSNTTALDMLEEYLTFSDANDDSSLYFACDPAMMLGSDGFISDETLLPQKEMDEGTEQGILRSQQLTDDNLNTAASLSDKPELAKYQSDFQYSFVKKASQMLGSIPAPPAFAAEFPSKDAVVRLNSVLPSSSSTHVTAGVIQIRNETNQFSGKHENFNVVLSFGFSHGDDGSSSLESRLSIVPGKTVSSISRNWLFFISLCVLIFSTSFKILTCICAS